MTARQFVAIGLRLFAIWLCISALQIFGVTSALQAATASYGTSAPEWMGFVIVGVLVAVGLVVWVISGPMATGLLSGLVKTQEVKLSVSDLVVVGCVLMGLWWLKESIVPFIVFWLQAFALSSGGAQPVYASLSPSAKFNMVTHLLQIVIAIFFIARPYIIANWVLRTEPSTAANLTDES
jgi:hypothetical protein